MTRIEKQIVLDALGYYVHAQEDYIKSIEQEYGDRPDIAFHRAHVNTTKSVMSYWKNVIDEPCGTVYI